MIYKNIILILLLAAIMIFLYIYEPNTAIYIHEKNINKDTTTEKVSFDRKVNINNKKVLELHSQGTAFFKKGNHVEAQSSYIQALKINPSSSDIYSSLASANYVLGNKYEAKLNWNKSLEIDGKNITSLNGLSTLAYDNKRYSDSINIATKVLKLSPNDYAGLWNLAISYDRLKNNIKALTYFQKFIDIRKSGLNVEYAIKRLKALKAEKHTPNPYQVENI